jgi:NAD(P)-dependent dehydrogenase (short-subunit alcohol dehydrogenase family)
VVTGAAQGIGFAVARRLASEGAEVVIADRQAEAGCDGARLIESQGGRARALPVDIARPDCGEVLVKGALDAFGRVDAAVLCAGIAGMKDWLELTAEDWDRMMDVNLRGTMLCLQALGRQMIAQGEAGAMVTLAATSGHGPRSDAAHYGASKAGIIHLTRSAALGLGCHRIRVNAISPGIVNTGMWRGVVASRAALQGVAPERYEQEALGHVPLGRAAEPDDIAALASFLLSDEASYITGEIIVVDGGYSLRVA